MDIFLNILLTIIFSIITCITYDIVKSYILSKKLKKLSITQVDSWSDFWNGNIPIDSDFTDKEE